MGLLSVAPNGDLLTKVARPAKIDDGDIRLTGETIELVVRIGARDRLTQLSSSGDDGGEWVFDRNRRELVKLGSAPGLASVHAAGPHVTWRAGKS